MTHTKDAVLDALASKANIAQFVSFSPKLELRYAHVSGLESNFAFPTPQEAVRAVFEASTERSVNVRSFLPEDPKSREFVYGLRSVEAAWQTVARLAGQGLYTIVNETINTDDGGVSGVLLDDLIEFAPDDTPRCVEKPGTAALPRTMGVELLKTVYGFEPHLNYARGTRVEFSIHPVRCGVRNSHTVVWELEDVGDFKSRADVRWPNRFSRIIGDKAYGLLIGALLELPVPRTRVFSRRIAPFSFGESTGTAEPWIRTCPVVQVPGKFTTHRGWLDPFDLMAREDPRGDQIASIIAQEGVDAQFSGAALGPDSATLQASLVIEGTRGYGDEFMVGVKKRAPLPDSVLARVRELYDRAAATLGPVRMEWVADQNRAWLVQFHRGGTASSGTTIFPGEPARFHEFAVERGLEALRALVAELSGSGDGIVLRGDVGVTSHLGDILRAAKIPSRIET